MAIRMLRIPAVLDRRGNRSRSQHYADIAAGTWTPGVALGKRARAWPEHEVEALLAARLAGATDEDMRRVVSELLAQRGAAHSCTGGRR